MSSSYRPFVRQLVPGPPIETGDDVLVVQEVLRSIGILTAPYRPGQYAENTWEAVERLGKLHGHEANNTYGSFMHTVVSAHMTPMQGFRLAMALGNRLGGGGERIGQAALWYHQAGPYNYDQGRPFHLLDPPLIAWALDCSSFAITSVHAAGLGGLLKDPENQHGFGNTRSMIREGHSVPWQQARAGDMVHYTTPAGFNEHMGVCLGNGQTVQHGEPGYPELRSINVYPIVDVRRLTAA